MQSNTFLLCLAVTICVAAANPLLQALTAQTCPICQQNTYRNQPYVLPQPATNIPPCSHVVMNQNSLSSQPVCKNPSPYNQLFSDPNNEFTPTIVKKFLSNPVLKSVLDPNTRLYNQDGVEVPRNVPCSNGVPNVINNYFIIPPEFYLENAKCNSKEDRRIVDDSKARNRSKEDRKRPRQDVNNRPRQKTRVATERGDNNKRIKERDGSVNNNGEVRKRKMRRRPNKSITTDVKLREDIENTATEGFNQIESPQLRNQDQMKAVAQAENNQTVTSEDICKNWTKEQEQNKQVTISSVVTETTLNPVQCQEVTETSPLVEESTMVNDEAAKDTVNQTFIENLNMRDKTKEKNGIKDIEPEFGQNEETSSSPQTIQFKINQRKDDANANSVRRQQQRKPITHTNQKNNQPQTNAAQRGPTVTNGESDKMLKTSRNPKEEAIIQDFLKKFPNIPEELVRRLLDHMKRRIEKEQIGSTAFPYKQFPITYKSKFLNLGSPDPVSTTNASLRKKPRRRNNRRRKQRKQKAKTEPESCTTVVELTPTIVDEEHETSTVGTTATTTEKPFTVEEVTLKPIKVTLAAEFVTEVDTVEATTPKINDIGDINDITHKNGKDKNLEHQTANINELHEKIENQIASINEEYEKPSHTEEKDEIIKKSSEEIDTDYNSDDQIIELGSEDVLPTMYMNGLVEDYYPDFTNDNQYYSSEDLPIITLEDGRYHYTTDKNFELEELNRERRKYENDIINGSKKNENRYGFRFNSNKGQRPRSIRRKFLRKISKPRLKITSTAKPIILETTTYRSKSKIVENNANRPETVNKAANLNYKSEDEEASKTESLENSTENIIQQNIEEVQFRTPPTLEIIDFETKQIDKDKYYLQDGGDFIDKTSTYSDFKTPQYNVNKKGDLKLKAREKNKQLPEIETVFARSKVATYSRPYNEEAVLNEKDFGESDAVSGDSFQFVNDDYDDGDKMVVYAKSLPDTFWR